MSQNTLYLDDATQTLEELIRTDAAHEWPQECFSLAGRFADFPLRENVSPLQAPDTPKTSF